MPTVTFRSTCLAAPVVCEYEPDGEITLLELARLYDVPLHWRCGLGTCGTCAARVTVVEGPRRPFDNKEHNVLKREGYTVDPEQLSGGWRTACSYLLTGATLLVEW